MFRFICFLACATFVSVSLSNSQTWQDVSGLWRAEVKDLAVGRSASANYPTLYDIEPTKLIRTSTGGTAWENTAIIQEGTPIVVTCKSTSPNNVTVSFNGYVHYSTDNGSNWTVSNTLHGLSSFTPKRIAASPIANSDVILLGLVKDPGQSSMWRSTDNGSHWTYVSYFVDNVRTHVKSIAYHPSDASKIWAGGSSDPLFATQEPPETFIDPYTRGVFFSEDAGNTWDNSGDLSKNVNALAVYTSGATTYIFAATDEPSNKLMKTTDNGANWSPVTSYTYGLINDIKTVDIYGTNVIYIAATNGVFYSTDNGSSWQDHNCNGIYDHSNITRIGFDPQNPITIFAGSGSAIYKSTNAGYTWTNSATDITRMPTSAISVDGATTVALSSAYAVAPKNSGSVWSYVGVGCGGDFRGIMAGFVNSSVVFASGYREGVGAALWRSTDGGSSGWSEQKSGEGYTSGKFNGTLADPVNVNRVYAFGLRVSTENIYVAMNATSNGGTSWDSVSVRPNGASAVPEISDMAIDSRNPGPYSSNVLYASVHDGSSNEKGVWKSTDAGITWSRLSHALIQGKAVRALGMSPQNGLLLYAAGDSNGTYWLRKSEDAGATWTTVTSITSQVTKILMHPSHPDRDNLFIVAGRAAIQQCTKKMTLAGQALLVIFPLRCMISEARQMPVLFMQLPQAAFINLISSQQRQ